MEIYSKRVTDLRIDYRIADAMDLASGTMTATIDGFSEEAIEFCIHKDGSLILEKRVTVNSEGLVQVDFEIENPELWYPHGYGAQALYNFSASVGPLSRDPLSITHRVGVKKTELLQRLDDIGKSFYFKVNEQEVFCGGSNWIPADSFTPRISPDRYRKWLQMMVDGNQTMIRYVDISGSSSVLRTLGYGVGAYTRKTYFTTSATS
jgi:beta-mannosidase